MHNKEVKYLAEATGSDKAQANWCRLLAVAAQVRF
jgi:hypothetical protein